MRISPRSILCAVVCLTAALAVNAQHKPKLKPMPPEMREKLFGKRTPAPPSTVLTVPTAEETLIKIPEEAVRTESGLAYRALAFGDGNESPNPNDSVTIHFTGWNGRGTIFNDTRRTGKPRSFQVNRASAGLAEGLQLMVKGSKFQFWARESLLGNEPAQLMQYEVELLSIKPAPEPPATVAAAPADAIGVRSGMKYQILSEGRGTEHPLPEDLVTLHYEGWTNEGMLLGSSYQDDQPQSITVGESFHVFDEAVQEMIVGEKRRVWVDDVDFGKDYEGPAMFDIELVSVLTKPRAPRDVEAPPDDAIIGEAGLFYKVLQPGSEDQRPVMGQTVVVHYSTWKRSGELLDSNFNSGRPVGVPLDENMPRGWTMALESMTIGEKRRIWIPRELSFPDAAGREPVPLVFDVELLAIVE
jgi:FKBP-type peptidyl-prolyl cis-trans isomerase